MANDPNSEADRENEQVKAMVIKNILDIIYGPGDVPTRDEAERRLKASPIGGAKD
jgi:hypothetical protein